MGIPIGSWVSQMQDMIIERMLYHEHDGKQSAASTARCTPLLIWMPLSLTGRI